MTTIQEGPGIFSFAFNRVKSIPRLAWSIQFSRGVDEITVYHGESVETTKNFFVEGAWAGEFRHGRFDNEVLMGSGGRISDGQLVLACPDHTLDRIFTYSNDEQLLASNSLAFLLSQLNDRLDPTFLFYDALLATIRDGISTYQRRMSTASGKQIRLHYHCNVYINVDMSIEERPKVPVRDFLNYQDYIGFLSENVSAICANASDELRTTQYTPVATISSGYDSPACAVFARNVGCRTALTFSKARGINKEDSGLPIAKALGLDVETHDRLAYKNSPDFPEAECQGGPSEFSSLVDSLKEKVVFVGFHGDKVWDCNAKASTTIVRSDASGFGLTELRLRTGFILMAIPFIGCTSHPSIHRISNSDEMRPWRLDNSYDRPIPRRLVEEAGINREWFGAKKRATGIYVTEEGLNETLSSVSYRDFTAFCEANWRASFAVKSQMIGIARSYMHFINRANRLISRTILGRGLGLKIPHLLPKRLTRLTYGYSGREALLFHWGVEKMQNRYSFDR